MFFDIIFELKKIILNTKNISSTYSQKYTNTKYSLDLIIHEILYFLKSGVSWAMLRSPINSKTLFWHYSRFVKNNIFFKLFSKIRNKYVHNNIPNKCSLLIDSSTIYNKFGINKIGRNKYYKNKITTKISLLTDINGFPLSILFMKGNYHDNSVFEKHIRDAQILLPKNKIKIIADKAYSSHKNIDHLIPPRRNMKMASTYKYDCSEYVSRIKIEHIFCRLKTFRRLGYRWDKYLRNFSGFVFLAFSIIAQKILLAI